MIWHCESEWLNTVCTVMTYDLREHTCDKIRLVSFYGVYTYHNIVYSCHYNKHETHQTTQHNTTQDLRQLKKLHSGGILTHT